ncbi:MAG: ParB/RepB/Spo0J family partition protein [Christensenellales bacterium]|jgi:ParB family chromosome partitioning protein
MYLSETNQARDKLEEVQQISLSQIHPFPEHPFQVRDDELMQQTIDSIQQVGILTPVILRPDDSGGFEMISGHRRLYAAGLAGLDTIPAIVRNMTDDEAIIFMVDSNLQRETILPSERAKAYKMKLDAIKRQGSRTDLTSVQVGQKLTSRERIAESSPDSPSQIRRFIRLNELDPALLKMVDDGKIGLTPAVELSFLNPQEQTMLLDTIDSEQATPSLSQAQRMKKLSGEGKLNDDTMLSIMMEQKKPENWNLTLPMDRIRKFFPRSFTPQQMENTILKLLEAWQKKRQRQNEH